MTLPKPIMPRKVNDEADTIDHACNFCGNATSAAQRGPNEWICAFCLNERVEELRVAHRNRYRRRPRVFP